MLRKAAVSIVHLNMLLRANHPINCNVAKSIRLPVACRTKCSHSTVSIEVKNDGISDLFYYKYGSFETLFYITGNVIKFTNYHYSKRNKTIIVPLFDYKNGTYKLLSISKKISEETPEIFFRTPNGDLYCISNHNSLTDSSMRKTFTINNLTKKRVIFSYIKEKEHDWRIVKQDSDLFSTLSYTKPIYNSFIVIMRTDAHDHLRKTCIYFVDLIDEKVEEIPYNLKGYIENHFYNFVHTLKELHNLTINTNDIFLKSNIDFERLLPSSNVVSAWGDMSDDCKLIKYQDETPIYSECHSTFVLYLKSNVYYQTTERQKESQTELSCDVKIQLSVYVENNEINILLTCKRVEINLLDNSYDNSKDEVLLHKKYTFNNRYNINKSQLYSISVIDDDYLFKDGKIYKFIGDSYKPVCDCKYGTTYMLKHDELYITAFGFGQEIDRVFAIILPKHLKSKKSKIGKYISVNDAVIDLNKIREIINTYARENKKAIIVDISKYVVKIDLKELVNYVKKTLREKEIRYSEMHYDYYIDEKTGYLYMFLIFYSFSDENVQFMIVKYNIWEQPHQSRIMLLTDIYKFKSIVRTRLQNKYKLLSEVIKNMAHEKNKGILFFDLLYHLFEKHLNKTPCGWSIYENEILVMHNSYSVEFNDIKYNRQSKMRNNSLNKVENRIEGVVQNVERYRNVLLHSVKSIKHSINFRYDFLIIISEMNIVSNIKLLFYK